MAKSKKEKSGDSKKSNLKNFDIKVNKFGEIITSHNVDEINEFLDENVEDKKLSNTTSSEEE